MRNALVFFVSIILFNACRTASIPSFPKGPRCLIGEAGCVCNDPTRKPADYVLTFEECQNYVATTLDMEDAMDEWASKNCTK